MVGIVVIAHGNLASGLVDAAMAIMGEQAHVHSVGLMLGEDLDEFCSRVLDAIQQEDRGQGVLVLADLVGGTPWNRSVGLLRQDIEVIGGANLGVLLEAILQRSETTVAELAQRIVSEAPGTICRMPHLNESE